MRLKTGGFYNDRMSDDQRKLKEQLMEHYSQALDGLFADCPEGADFVVLEEQVEKLASKTLPATLGAPPLDHRSGHRRPSGKRRADACRRRWRRWHGRNGWHGRYGLLSPKLELYL